jgi:predicted  nucleic acid-binding Zn-ribbon protein
MMATLGQKLYRLQVLDTELAEHRSRLRETQSLLGETREVLDARAAQDKAAKELTQQRARLKDLEFALQQLDTKITATAARLYGGQVSNPKELHGLEQDHDYLKRARDKQEDDVLQAMNQVEDAEKGAAAAATQLTAVESRWRAEQDKLTRQAELLQTKVTALKKDRAALAGPLDVSARATYEELMQKKGGRAIALLVGQTCGGCRVTLASGRLQEVRRSQQLITCPNCGRILVVKD